jgi:flavin reductase (DIM6/NTAB) family NADH-FMN oxidoreductase RutF
MKTFDPSAIAARDIYRLMIGLITPRPIAWVSSISPGGVINLAPFSFYNGVAASPPTILFSAVNHRDGRKKDTVVNVEATGEFVVNVVSYELREPMNVTSEEIPYEMDELAKAGLTVLPSVRVTPPRVKEARAHLECTVHQIVRVGEGPLAANLVIGRILLIHVDEQVLDPAGSIDPAALDTIGRMGGEGYVRTTDRFSLPRPRTGP